MSETSSFLSSQDEETIIIAIKEAEKNTSGEIRVHIEAHSDEDHYEHAKKIFGELNMHETKLRNGVLFYVAVNDHKFVILGDQGINDKVSDGFWDATKEIMQDYFRKGAYKEGLVDGILKAGCELKTHFPYQDDDMDELSNQISKS